MDSCTFFTPRDSLICAECPNLDRDYAPECSSCPDKGVIESEMSLIPVLELDDGCRWVKPLPACS